MTGSAPEARVSPTDRFSPSPAVVARVFEGETVLMRIAGSVADMRSLYVLNPMGTRIWARLDGATPLQAIVEELVTSYEVEDEVARADAIELVTSLLAADLIERQPDA